MSSDMTKKTNTDLFDFDFFDDDMASIMTLMMMIMMVYILGQMNLSSTTQSAALSAMSYHGVEDPRIVNATGVLSWLNFVSEYPFTPWISAYIINDGPSDVNVAINNPDNMFTIRARETNTINRTGALDEKISIIYFKCNTGTNATLRVMGTY